MEYIKFMKNKKCWKYEILITMHELIILREQRGKYMKEVKHKRNVVLADCPADEIRNLLEGMNSVTDNKFECISEVACGIRTGLVSELKRYFAYFVAAWHAYKRRNEYNIVVGWQQFYALIFCFYCNLFHTRKQNIVVALNFTYREKKGMIGKIYSLFINKCINGGYLDYIHVPSNDYADVISKQMGFPREKIIVTSFGIDDIYIRWKDSRAPKGYIKNSYAMSIGRSNRDFDLLINIWKDIEFPLIIISDTYNPPKTLPKNVNVIGNIAGDDQYPYIANAKFVIIPIKDGRICSGDTVLLTALSFEKTVIVTIPSTLGEMYIKDGENGYLVSKNQIEMMNLIKDIISNERPELGEKARMSYLDNFSRFSMGKKVSKIIGEKNV